MLRTFHCVAMVAFVCLLALPMTALCDDAPAPSSTVPSTSPSTSLPTTQAGPVRFSVSFPKETLGEPFSGRVVIWLSQENREPRNGPNWFLPDPIYSAEFTNIQPGQTMTIDDSNVVGFPGKIAELPQGQWYVQAVVDRNLGGRSIGSSPGNLYSKSTRIPLDGHSGKTVELVCDQVVPERKLVDTELVKFVQLRSALLSDFYHRETFLRAAVIVPPEASSDQPAKRFPTIYSISGFGGSIDMIANRRRRMEPLEGIPFISVALDANCPTGHSVFADSDNNGPWGKALTTELIPEIDKRFPTLARADARLVTGHSSGGWSSLWLQVSYPTVFGGCWSTAPDPVDFRDFQQIDLYKPNQNLFINKQGKPRPLARQGNVETIYYKSFTQMERPIRGEQIGSFEAVFGGRGADGEPAYLYDRDTGAIDPAVVEQWKRYDIGLILREHWKELEPNLAGKIHVYTGESDTFYLDGATKLLRDDMKRMNADATIELVPGDHATMMTSAMRKRISHEMAEQFRHHATPEEVRAIEQLPATQPTTLPATAPTAEGATTRRAA